MRRSFRNYRPNYFQKCVFEIHLEELLWQICITPKTGSNNVLSLFTLWTPFGDKQMHASEQTRFDKSVTSRKMRRKRMERQQDRSRGRREHREVEGARCAEKGGFHTWCMQKVQTFWPPSPIPPVTCRNQLILFLLSAFWAAKKNLWKKLSSQVRMKAY